MDKELVEVKEKQGRDGVKKRGHVFAINLL